MMRSKSRSGSSDLGKRSHKSAIRRTLSSSRFCRGNPLVSQIDKNALKPVEQKPCPKDDSSEKQEVIATMQQHINQVEEELKNVKEQLNVTREEKERTLEQLRETKIAAREANTKPTETLPSPMIGEVLKMKEKEIKSLKLELKKARAFDMERETKMKIKELEDEVERTKLKEKKVYDRAISQSQQLEGTKIELEESKLEVSSLRQAITQMMALNREKNSASLKGAYKPVSMDGGQEKIDKEINSLKSEGNLEIKAEEKSSKAVDDLALALEEVSTEANQAKQELASTVEELRHVKDEVEQLKETLETTEDKYKKQIEDEKKEIERCKNTIERLILENEESLLAWNDKEIGFVSFIKKAEEDNTRLLESLKEAETLTKTSREENLKLRDILKQALSESNVAKEAASLARIENSQLKNALLEKEEALDPLVQENQQLNKIVKELKRLLSPPVDKEKVEKSSTAKDSDSKHKKSKDVRSINPGELKIPNMHRKVDERVLHEDPVKAEALRGSIFDNVESPISEPRTPQHKRVPSPFELKSNSEDVDHNEDSDSCGDENDKSSQRKVKAILSKFGDLIRRKNSNKESSLNE